MKATVLLRSNGVGRLCYVKSLLVRRLNLLAMQFRLSAGTLAKVQTKGKIWLYASTLTQRIGDHRPPSDLCPTFSRTFACFVEASKLQAPYHCDEIYVFLASIRWGRWQAR
jgi:hypothetical protein